MKRGNNYNERDSVRFLESNEAIELMKYLLPEGTVVLGENYMNQNANGNDKATVVTLRQLGEFTNDIRPKQTLNLVVNINNNHFVAIRLVCDENNDITYSLYDPLRSEDYTGAALDALTSSKRNLTEQEFTGVRQNRDRYDVNNCAIYSILGLQAMMNGVNELLQIGADAINNIRAAFMESRENIRNQKKFSQPSQDWQNWQDYGNIKQQSTQKIKENTKENSIINALSKPQEQQKPENNNTIKKEDVKIEHDDNNHRIDLINKKIKKTNYKNEDYKKKNQTDEKRSFKEELSKQKTKGSRDVIKRIHDGNREAEFRRLLAEEGYSPEFAQNAPIHTIANNTYALKNKDIYIEILIYYGMSKENIENTDPVALQRKAHAYLNQERHISILVEKYKLPESELQNIDPEELTRMISAYKNKQNNIDTLVTKYKCNREDLEKRSPMDLPSLLSAYNNSTRYIEEILAMKDCKHTKETLDAMEKASLQKLHSAYKNKEKYIKEILKAKDNKYTKEMLNKMSASEIQKLVAVYKNGGKTGYIKTLMEKGMKKDDINKINTNKLREFTNDYKHKDEFIEEILTMGNWYTIEALEKMTPATLRKIRDAHSKRNENIKILHEEYKVSMEDLKVENPFSLPKLITAYKNAERNRGEVINRKLKTKTETYKMTPSQLQSAINNNDLKLRKQAKIKLDSTKVIKNTNTKQDIGIHEIIIPKKQIKIEEKLPQSNVSNRLTKQPRKIQGEYVNGEINIKIEEEEKHNGSITIYPIKKAQPGSNISNQINQSRKKNQENPYHQSNQKTVYNKKSWQITNQKGESGETVKIEDFFKEEENNLDLSFKIKKKDQEQKKGDTDKKAEHSSHHHRNKESYKRDEHDDKHGERQR